jgi:transcriptional regulator with XRE-family HTH domain
VQARLAKLCGWDTTVISKVERGKQNLTLKRVQRLARALGTAEAALLRR